jgi:transposase-like protein
MRSVSPARAILSRAYSCCSREMVVVVTCAPYLAAACGTDLDHSVALPQA